MTPRAYSAGRRKTSTEPSSVVRVYERKDVGGFFVTMAWDRLPSGRAIEHKLPDVTTWEQAKATADALAAERRVRILRGRHESNLQHRKVVTLKQLLDAYADSAEAGEWSDKHRADQDRADAFWLGCLGGDTPVEDLRKSDVERHAQRARKAAGYSTRWERRKIARLRAAVRWGYRKADLYDSNPLDGVELPEYTPDTDRLIYTEDETRKLLTPHDDVDWRVTLLANVIADTGRRITATLALTVADVIVPQDAGRVALHYRPESDKTKRGQVVPVSADTALLLLAALERDDVQHSGLLIPSGKQGHDGPWTKGWAARALHRAESVLEIKRVRGRAWHGLKRRAVTTGVEVAHGDPTIVGDMSGNRSHALILGVYRKQSRRRKEGHVDRLREALKGGEVTRQSTRDHRDDSGGTQNAAECRNVSELARVDSNHHRRFQRPEPNRDQEVANGDE